MTDDRIAHWDRRYAGTAPDRLSWFEPAPERSLAAIRAAAAPAASVIDVGGGASSLPDGLIRAGYQDVTVLDLSGEALALSRDRLGDRAGLVRWIVGDVTVWKPDRTYDLWHDRAVFHFLTRRADRAAYAERLLDALRPGGQAILMTFAEDGPETCSGLPVRRYSPEMLAAEMEALTRGALQPVVSERFTHVTPGGVRQRFQLSRFERQ